MSEELLQVIPARIGRYLYYRIGNSTLRQLKAAGIINMPVPREIAAKKPDGLVVLDGGHVKTVVEYKPQAKMRTREQVRKAIDQEIAVARHLCKTLVVTSGTTTVWVNALNGERIRAEDGAELRHVFDGLRIINGQWSAEEQAALERLIDKIDHSLTADQNRIASPDVLDPSSLANAVWQKIWINTGKDPEKCLYNVVELFIFKFLSDLGLLEAHNNFGSVYRLVRSASPGAALEQYATICRKEVERPFPKGDDGTTIINGTIFVNEYGAANQSQARLFAEILEDLQGYDNDHGSFKYIKREFKTRLYESFLRQSAGIRFMGQFFTPRNVVQAVISMSDASTLQSGNRVCDPFCGVGGFLLELIVGNPHIMAEFEPRDGNVAPAIDIVGYDKGTDELEDERTIILAKANMLIYMSDFLARYQSTEFLRTFTINALNRIFTLLRSNLGTFARIDDAKYDLILTNPPYVTSGSGSLKQAISDEGLSGYYDASGRGTESLAIQWIVNNLKSAGQAVVIVPDGLLKQDGMLSWIKERCIVEAVVSLPSRTFYATPRATYILCLRRKPPWESRQESAVFLYLASEIGETRDARRFPTPESNDLREMAGLFRQFRGMPNDFVTENTRCIVLPFDEFDSLKNWMVERVWSREARIALRAEEETITVTDGEYRKEVARLREHLSPYPAVTPMDRPNMQAVALCDPQHFVFVTAKTNWTKQTFHEIGTGVVSDHPVYSAAKGPVAFVEADNDNLIECAEDKPLFSFGANGDGSAGTNFVIHRRPFYVSRDRTVVSVKTPTVLPEFVCYQLRTMKQEYGFCFAYKAVPTNLDQVMLDIPLTSGGDFDVKTQRDVVERHEEILTLKKTLEVESAKVQSLDVALI